MSDDFRDTVTPLLRKIIDDLSGTYTVTLTPAANTSGTEASNTDKLKYLAEQERDFLRQTPEMTRRIVDDFNETARALLAESLPLTNAFLSIGGSVKAHIVERFAQTGVNGPPDEHMPALSPRWKAHKKHGRIGIYTGHLATSMADARVTTRKG